MRRISAGVAVLLMVLSTAAMAGPADTTDTTVGVQGNARSQGPSVSPDGRLVGFVSIASNLVAGDTNEASDVFVRDRRLGVTELISVGLNGAPANADSFGPSVTGDRRFVAFTSDASNLVADDTNEEFDVFVRDRRLGVTERVSVGNGGVEGNTVSFRTTISENGRFVTFTSRASNLVADDNDEVADIIVRDRRLGVTELISVGLNGAQSNGESAGSAPSADGRFVAFGSSASNLVADDKNEAGDVFLRDRRLGVTELISVGLNGAPGNGDSVGWSISADGRFVAFGSNASNLVADDTNEATDVFVRDRRLGVTERISIDSDEAEANARSHFLPLLSGDGRFVAFATVASNLVPGDGDTNGWFDMFVRDRRLGVTERISVGSDGAQGNGESATDSVGVGISADGRIVTFTSAASNLVAGDTNEVPDVFVRDRRLGVTERISVGSDGAY